MRGQAAAVTEISVFATEISVTRIKIFSYEHFNPVTRTKLFKQNSFALQGSRLTFQLAGPVASDRFDSLAKTVFSLARYSNSVSARKLYLRAKVGPEDLF